MALQLRTSDLESEKPVSPAIIVLGSGLAVIPDPPIYRNETIRAIDEGYDILINGGSAVDAVEKAVNILEEHDHFNAGRGSCLNECDEVECDAMIMDGHNLKTGAVITARHFPHPVSIARKIMDESCHCALSGEGALKFANSLENFDDICNPEDLKGGNDCPNQRKGIRNSQFEGQSRNFFMGSPIEAQEGDTVGAVAIDSNGYLACANSAGGIPGKLKGRVSDASLVGCGGYANKFGAAVTTGHGESIIKVTLAREVVYNIEKGQSAQEAAVNALKKMEASLKDHNYGGVIAIDQDGKPGADFTIKQMVWGSKKDGKRKIYMPDWMTPN